MKHLIVTVFFSAALVGCSDGSESPFVRVSGVVTINGAPAPDVVVRFSPVPTGSSGLTGGMSRGYTDADGRFSLKSAVGQGRPGAVKGTHTVTFLGSGDIPIGEDQETGEPIYGGDLKFPTELRREGLSFEVPSGGTDEANFSLEL